MSLSNKLTVILFLGLFSQFSFGQRYFVNKKKISYFSLTGGANFSLPHITDRYAILSSADKANEEDFEKKYDKLSKNTGAQFSARYQYNFTNAISVIGGFGYKSVGFKYFTHYSWMDTVDNQEFNREMHHLQKISYFTLPIMARWDMTTGQLMPFIQAGIFMDFRHQAKKVILYDNTIDEEVDAEKASTSAMVSISDYTRKFNMGVMGGIGLSYHTKYLVFGLESNFRFGFRKIMNDQNRYADLNGFALQYLDVLDQMRLSTIDVQLSVAIPLNHAITLNILRRKNYRK
jgi:hypothetical protein